MFEIIFLGTSASAPSAHRGMPALIVKFNEHRFLVDCGEGTQRQILQSGLGFKKLNRILVTHGHLDHILGIGGLVSTYLRWEAIDELEIFGGASALERVQDLIYRVVMRGAPAPFPIRLSPIKRGLVLEEKEFTVNAFPVSHRGPDCFGYIFESRGKRPFLPDRAEALGVPSGPLRRDLVAGLPVTLENGTTVQPDDVLGDFQSGVKLVIVGDTGETDSFLEVCRGADALVIESTYLQEEAEMAAQFAHLTAGQAASLASAAGVKELYLTHISRRYRERDVEKEARAIFPSSFVAHDFDMFQIRGAS